MSWFVCLYVCANVCYVSQLEEAAKEVADEVTRPRPVEEETVQDIQVMLKSDAHPASIRNLKVGVTLAHYSVTHCCSPAFLWITEINFATS